LLGGVRFKYQPVLSPRSVEEDLQVGMERCDAIVVTGKGTGLPTELDKIKYFREIINDFPLIVGAGLNLDNCIEQLSIADGGIVGSYLKEGHIDSGYVSPIYVNVFAEKVKSLRK
jgi:predicted TIM-barrel enzyme